MGLLDGFEKIINEHGSAAILKERISLANDKYAALEQKLSASEFRAKELESENQGLHLDLKKANIEVQNLKALTEKSHSYRLEEIKENILQFLCQNEYVATSQIARSLGKHSQLVTLHLTNLEKDRFVIGSFSTVEEAEWAIGHEGRAYLVQHGLLT